MVAGAGRQPGHGAADHADCAGVQSRRRAAHDQQRKEEQRDPRQSGRAARQGAPVVLDAAGHEEHGDKEPVTERIQLRPEDRVARGITVDEVKDHPGKERAEDDLQSHLRGQGHEADQEGDRDAHPDLGGRILQPDEEGVQPQVSVCTAEGHADRGHHDAAGPERDHITGRSS